MWTMHAWLQGLDLHDYIWAALNHAHSNANHEDVDHLVFLKNIPSKDHLGAIVQNKGTLNLLVQYIWDQIQNLKIEIRGHD